MRKLFTSVVAALCLAAPVGTLSAQNTQQLTEAQKEAIKKEVLPVVFEQIKEQAGIDILGWANPKLSDTFAGIPVLESSNLRAASAEAVSVKPDSIVISTSVLTQIGALKDYAALIQGMLGENLKIAFEDYTTTTLPISYGTHPITVELPSTINVSNLIYVYFNTHTESNNLLDFDVDFSLLGSKSDLVACTLGYSSTGDLEANVDIQDGLRDLVAAIPAVDYRITVGLAGMATGSIPATLYSVAEGSVTNTTPIGKADVVLATSENALFPVQKIEVTGYDTAGAVDSLSTFNFDMSKTTTAGDVVTKLVVDKFARKTVDAEDSTFINKTIITARDFTPALMPITPDAAVKSVINDVVYQLRSEGKIDNWYDLTISSTTPENETPTELAYISVSPYMADATTAIADVDVRIGGQNADTYTVRATADLKSQKIAVDVVKGIDTAGAVKYGTAYFTSNIAGVVTANESVEESVATMKVVPVQNAIRVTNVDKATYRIVSMTGAVVASGHINGDTYISTASLSQGIYIVAVEANGTLQSVKVKL